MSKRTHTDAENPQPRRSLLDRLNDVAMRVYGPAARSRQDLQGAQQSDAAGEWYREVQEHFVVEKDEHGNEYLYHRDDSGEGTSTGTSRN